jgi:hypothetical protein
LAREWTNGRESLEGCPPWQPQIQARRRRCEKIHPLTEPQNTRRGKTGKQILAREWTRILANPWRAVLRGSPRSRRAGTVTKNTSSHGAAKHTEGENRKADFGPRMDANPREPLEGCPRWQPQIQACRRRCEKIHPLTEPQSTRRGKTGKQILAREWTRILANPWRAVLRGSPRSRRAGAVTKKYILSRSHEAHGGGKPESRFWPANGRKSSRILGGLSSVAAADPGVQAPLRQNTSHGATKHTKGKNRKADFSPQRQYPRAPARLT